MNYDEANRDGGNSGANSAAPTTNHVAIVGNVWRRGYGVGATSPLSRRWPLLRLNPLHKHLT